MKLSKRRFNKAIKKKAQGRKLRPADVYVIKEGNYRKLLNQARTLRTVLSVVTIANAAAQIAMLTSMPRPIDAPASAFIADKTLAAIRVTLDNAQALKKIFEQHPDPAREWMKKIIDQQPEA